MICKGADLTYDFGLTNSSNCLMLRKYFSPPTAALLL
jgi:hypothetical protein